MFGLNTMKKIILTILLGIVTLHVSASHLYGGELVWKCQNNGKYKFYLTMYRDCNGINYTNTVHTIFTNAPGGNFQVNRVSPDAYVAPICYSTTQSAQTLCNNTTQYGTGTLQKIVFESAEMTFAGTPPPSGWYFYHQDFARPSQLTNGGSNQAFIARAMMYPYTAPGSTSPFTGNPCYDSSPDFLEDPALLAVTNSEIVYNNLGYDPDLDSLYYDWAEPLSAFPSTSITWNTSSGYSASSPLPSGLGSTGAQLINETGEVSFTSAQAGSFATCLKVESWRCGQLIGEVFRDIPISILTQTTPTGLCASSYQPGPPLLTLTPDFN